MWFVQENLIDQVAEATAAGYRLEVHVIGDAAADAILTAIETANVAPEKRPILTHCQVRWPMNSSLLILIVTEISRRPTREKYIIFSKIILLLVILCVRPYD